MDRTFSQLVRIKDNLAVQFEVKVIPVISEDSKIKSVQWFKRQHWDEVVKLLSPSVEAHIASYDGLPKLRDSHSRGIFKGEKISAAFTFKPYCLASSALSSSNKTIQCVGSLPESQTYADLGGLHSGYKIHREKLIAVVCSNSDKQYDQLVANKTLTRQLYFKQEISKYFSDQKNLNRAEKYRNKPAVFTHTESITCLQSRKFKCSSIEEKCDPSKNTKALSTSQLGNGRKLRTSAVKLSPSSAAAQENVAFPKSDLYDSGRQSEDLNQYWRNRQSISSQIKLDDENVSRKRCADAKSKLSLKRKDKNSSVLDCNKRTKKESDAVKCSESCEQFKPYRRSSTDDNRRRAYDDVREALPSTRSLLVTSTESITCTVIGQDGRRNVAHRENIRVVDKRLNERIDSVTNRDSAVNRMLVKTSSESIDTAKQGRSDAKSIVDNSSWLQKKPIPCSAVRKKNVSCTEKLEPSNKKKCKLKDVRDDDARNDQRKMAEMFDNLIALSESHAGQMYDDRNFENCGDDSNDASSSESNNRDRDASEDVDVIIRKNKHLKDLSDACLRRLFQLNEPYLKDIYEDRIYCRRHQDYKKGGRSRIDLSYQVNLCMFNESQLDFLMELLMEVFGKKTFKNVDYLLKVMLPETLVKIFMDVRDVGHEEGERQMLDIMFDHDSSQHATFMRS